MANLNDVLLPRHVSSFLSTELNVGVWSRSLASENRELCLGRKKECNIMRRWKNGV